MPGKWGWPRADGTPLSGVSAALCPSLACSERVKVLLPGTAAAASWVQILVPLFAGSVILCMFFNRSLS